MSRPLRIEFPGAVYHVTSRGDRREPIYRDDVDREAQLGILAQAAARFDAQVLAYCQMGNHYHLVLHTRGGNLSRLMRQLNGVYTQAFNRRHGLVGHLFQGRFKAILVDRDAYLMALCRYVERNPVAAGLVASAVDWRWSSCRAHVGLADSPDWLDTPGLHAHLLGRPAASADDQRLAMRRYAKWVGSGQPGDETFWADSLRGQIFMGDEAFVAHMQAQAEPVRLAARAVPSAQRASPRSWAQHLAACGSDRNAALRAAYRDGQFTMTQLATLTALSVSHVSRIIAAGEVGEKGET